MSFSVSFVPQMLKLMFSVDSSVDILVSLQELK